ncbi:MAG TPA: hypothetical protein VJQ79_04330, partial [Acidimicrobiia bacterium]|nr:hypothetical protein [Acidimicrobiia bacterium]
MVDVRWLARFERVGLLALAAASAISVLGLAGWAFDIPLLTAGPGLGAIRPTQPWTFVLLAACAIGLRSALFKSLSRRTGQLLLITVSGLCGAFLLAGALTDPRVIPAVLRLVPEGGPHTGMVAPNQAFMLGAVALGGVLISSPRLTVRLSGQSLAAIAGVLASFILVAFAYGDRGLAMFPFEGEEMGLPSTMGTILLSAAAFFARPQDPMLRPLVSANLGGELLRWLVPIAFLIPAALVGTVKVQARFGTPGILAFITVAFTVLLLAGLLYASRRVDIYASRERMAAEEASRATDALKQVAPVMTDLVEILHSVPIGGVGRVAISTRHLPAVGLLAGDSLAVFLVRDRLLGIVMVDAAGHGGGPALNSVRLR